MSLLNDALNDLESKRGDSPRDLELPDGLSPGYVAASESKSSSHVFWVGLTGVFLVALALFLNTYFKNNRQSAVDVVRLSNLKTVNTEKVASHEVAHERDDQVDRIEKDSLEVTGLKEDSIANNSANEIIKETQQKDIINVISSETEKKSEVRPLPVAQAETPPIDNQYLHIQESIEARDNNTAQTARNLLRKNRVVEAKRILESFIGLAPSAIVSRQVLSDLLFEQNRKRELRQLLANSGKLDLSLSAYIRARLYLLQGDTDAALSRLENQTANPLIEEKYTALKAGLYQQSGLYEQAKILYANLLREHSESGTYWLGYALASDALNNPAHALQGFKQVLHTWAETGRQADQINDFARQRVVELSKTLSEELSMAPTPGAG